MAHHLGYDTPSSPVPTSSGRRQSLAAECSWADVARAIAGRVYADDVVPVAHVRQAEAAFDAVVDPSITTMRGDGRRNLRALWLMLAWGADWHVQDRRQQLLTSIPQRTLAARLGVTERTVRRHLRVLEVAGLLATVVEGSIPEVRPMAQRRPGDDEHNDVPVYVLTMPVYVLPDVPGGPELLAALQDVQEAHQEPHDAPEPQHAGDAPRGRRRGLHVVAAGDALGLLRRRPVDVNVRPSPGFPGEVSEAIPGTRARGDERSMEPLRGQPFSGHGAGRRDAAAPRRGLWTMRGRPGEHWDVNSPARRRAEQLAAADELRARIVALGNASAHAVRSAIREFLLAGWTVADIVHAVNWRPDGTHWAFDSLPWAGQDDAGDGEHRGRRAAAWLGHRLRAWRDDAGTVTKSRRQRDEAERAERAARQRAAADADARRLAERGTTDTGTMAAARDVARAAAERGTRTTTTRTAPPSSARVAELRAQLAARQASERHRGGRRATSTAAAIRRAEQLAAAARETD